MISLPGWSQVMSHGFITILLKRFTVNNDLQSGSCESVHTVPKTVFLHPSGSDQKEDSGALTSVGSMWSVIMWLSSPLSLYSR
jgi:hypothetical protein